MLAGVAVAGCAVEVAVLVGEAAVDVGRALGIVAVGVRGPGVGVRVGTVCRAGFWLGVAQATPESGTTKRMPAISRMASHCTVPRDGLVLVFGFCFIGVVSSAVRYGWLSSVGCV